MLLLNEAKRGEALLVGEFLLGIDACDFLLGRLVDLENGNDFLRRGAVLLRVFLGGLEEGILGKLIEGVAVRREHLADGFVPLALEFGAALPGGGIGASEEGDLLVVMIASSEDAAIFLGIGAQAAQFLAHVCRRAGVAEKVFLKLFGGEDSSQLTADLLPHAGEFGWVRLNATFLRLFQVGFAPLPGEFAPGSS